MRVEKREFSQLSCLGQTRTRVAWELTAWYYRARSKNSHKLTSKFDPAQSWWELMRMHESLAVKRERALQLASTLIVVIVRGLKIISQLTLMAWTQLNALQNCGQTSLIRAIRGIPFTNFHFTIAIDFKNKSEEWRNYMSPWRRPQFVGLLAVG
jgi:hypothetical protein